MILIDGNAFCDSSSMKKIHLCCVLLYASMCVRILFLREHSQIISSVSWTTSYSTYLFQMLTINVAVVILQVATRKSFADDMLISLLRLASSHIFHQAGPLLLLIFPCRICWSWSYVSTFLNICPSYSNFWYLTLLSSFAVCFIHHKTWRDLLPRYFQYLPEQPHFESFEHFLCLLLETRSLLHRGGQNTHWILD